MATSEKALQKVREICLALPLTREGTHFGVAAFYVRDKLFATCGLRRGVCQITFGLELEHAAALAESDPRYQLYPRDKRGVVIDAAQVKNWGEIKRFLLESYRLRAPSPKKRPVRPK